MNSLLYKPFRAFTIYALVILACSIPVYYIVVNHIWLSELDEHNTIIKDQVVHGLAKENPDSAQFEQLLHLWNRLQPGTTITPGEAVLENDSFYIVMRKNEFIENETDRFRGLLTGIKINGKAYTVRVETNVEEADETILAISLVTFIFFILLVAGFIVLNKRIAANVWRPFYDTLEKLRSFNLVSGNTVSFNKTSVAEFEELHTVLRRLIDNNVSVFRQQKVFIENASHELQTPLAVLKSKTDILLQDTGITADQAELLNVLQSQLARVTRINKNLLLLAKIENNQFSDSEELNVLDILKENLVLLADHIGGREVTLMVTDGVSLAISCNRFLLETLVNNLLINAIKHSEESSKLLIELSDRTLHVSNVGETELKGEDLFKRFYISSTKTTSSGLGLAIIKEIVTQYQWKIGYSFNGGFHRFSVSF